MITCVGCGRETETPEKDWRYIVMSVPKRKPKEVPFCPKCQRKTPKLTGAVIQRFNDE